ncbi:hypothetical protein NQ314_013602 [Rhamnusium bicolor]|uniref:DDE-1 domain-containing protein n=1 Tax=Rhamnusium bicolor TaxID=1586634 RepID=A0AAV8X6D5_9CUCU|nr:hypothetical protein NQ314_013602 [Rhamnusium bicolor]
MDQNAICLTKLFYRKSLLAEILTNGEKDLVKCLKTLNLRHAVCLLHNAWEKVPASSLEKCWKTILKPKNENDLEDDPEDLISLSVMRQKIRLLAEEIDAMSSMLYSIGNVDIDAGETIDWIDSDAKLIEHENLIQANDSADSDNDVMEIATPV